MEHTHTHHQSEEHKHHLIADISQKAIIEKDSRVLLVLDSNQQWELPGGRLHVDEEPVSGLKREIKEELNLDIDQLGIVHCFVFRRPSGHTHFVVVYNCVSDNLASLEINKTEVKEMKWVTKDDFDDLPMFAGYRETLQKFFGRKIYS